MARCEKSRRVCHLPAHSGLWRCSGQQTENLTVEELETIRLCDLEELSQDAASIRMEVSRGTFQRILYRARKKVASALVNGSNIEIRGGNYQLADCFCGCGTKCQQCSFFSGKNEAHEK